MAFQIPSEFGLVVLVIAAYCVLNMWMGFQVGKARRRYNVPYPTLYVTESENKDAKLFNCVQRGHQNSLEYMPMFFVLAILSGLEFPRVTMAFGTLYIISRYLYFIGYASGVPDKRLTYGKYNFLALFGLLGGSLVGAVRMLSN